jgi:endogenous inhibitor of DNA gyrase (YacG/DUF329 family)
MKKSITVKCPTCTTDVEWTKESAFRPFCSERCKLIDLGAWAAGDHKIAGESVPTQPSDDSANDS